MEVDKKEDGDGLTVPGTWAGNEVLDFWIGPFNEYKLPKAYGGCTCVCHRMPNVYHCMPCCYPGKEGFFPKSDQNLV
jgi:hypothetical protein